MKDIKLPSIREKREEPDDDTAQQQHSFDSNSSIKSPVREKSEDVDSASN